VAATVLSEMMPLLLDRQRARALRARFELRIRGGGRFHLHIFDQTAWATPVSAESPDCVVCLTGSSALLIGLGRQRLLRAVASGRALAFGRRPWLGPRLGDMFLTP
jgi:hypothetical protein